MQGAGYNNEYAFSVSEGYVCGAESGTVQLNVGGATLRDVLIDSEASCNVVDKETWQDLERQGIKCTSRKGKRLIQVFQRLKDKGLAVNPDKCRFQIPCTNHLHGACLM